MNEDRFSLIWDEGDGRQKFRSVDFGKTLNLNKYISIVSPGVDIAEGRDILVYLTKNAATVKRRAELFSALLNNPGFADSLLQCADKMRDIVQLQRKRVNSSDNVETSLYSVKELELYIDVVESFHAALGDGEHFGEALAQFRDFINRIYYDSEFSNLKANEKKFVTAVSHIKSVTVGVNLDAQFNPIEAGIVSINDRKFTSSKIVDKLLRLDFSKNDFECMPLKSVSGSSAVEKQIVNSIFLRTIGRLYANSAKSWQPDVRRYLDSKTAWVGELYQELAFINGCLKFQKTLSEGGYPLCVPELGSSDSIRQLYNPALAIEHSDKQIVKNDIVFDGDASIYILTGPNQGGKSVFLNSLGYAWAMLHLGMLIPARSAQMRLADEIFVYTNKKDNAFLSGGSFANECMSLSKISRDMTKDSIFLFDEALSTTGGSEAVYICREILSAYAEIGARGVFLTHFHELCSYVDEINGEGGKSKVGTLYALIEKSTHTRKYIIKKNAEAEASSYAVDIAKKYCLTKDDIISSCKAKMLNN